MFPVLIAGGGITNPDGLVLDADPSHKIQDRVAEGSDQA